ncbi:MAG: ATP-binding protein [Sulfurospirillaceae bacterium]|nr:ATP-binding protein [Sulfurospirillaceae bacterium]
MRTNIEKISQNFEVLEKQQVSALKTIVQMVAHDIRVKKAIKEANAASIIQEWKEKFEVMHREKYIMQFSLYDANHTALLRLHYPENQKEDERAACSTLDIAPNCSDFYWGLEIKPQGLLLLRFIQPVFEKDSIIGYVEIAKGIEDILDILHNSFQSHLAILLHKQYLNQSLWQEHMAMKKQSFTWDKHSDSVLYYTSLKSLPDFLLTMVEGHTYNVYKEVEVDQKKWLIFTQRFSDRFNNNIGDLLIMHNISDIKVRYTKFMITSGLIGLLLLLLVLALIYILLRQANISLLEKQEVSNRLQKIATRISGMIYQYRLYPNGRSCFPFASEAIHKIYKVSPQEVREDASMIFESLHPGDKHNVIRSIQQSANDLTPWRHEYRVVDKDGTERWLYGNAIPEKEADGSTLWHGFIEDITEHKLLENELKKMNEKLDLQVEQEVAARIQIQKEQERERQMLIQKSKLSSMGEMVGAIAHQWRQPLNALNMNIQNLEDDFDEGLVDKTFLHNFVVKNRQTILFMSKTIDDFRNFFKIDKEKKPFSALQAINETIALQSAQFKNQGIHLHIIGDDKELFGFKSEFQQVILNIINNAKDAILERKPSIKEITITLNCHSIEIEDSGGGIKKKVLERVFEPYFTTKEQGDGTGIGLYMAKMIIENNMGWKLEACNGKAGAKFTIIFG